MDFQHMIQDRLGPPYRRFNAPTFARILGTKSPTCDDISSGAEEYCPPSPQFSAGMILLSARLHCWVSEGMHTL